MSWSKIFKLVVLLLLLLSPWAIGWGYNLLLSRADLPQALSYLVAAVFLVFWFWVGQMFADGVRNVPLALLSGNLIIFASVAAYYWQMALITDPEQRIYPLVAFAQLPLAPVIFLAARIGVFIGKLIYPNAFMVTQPIWNIIEACGLVLVLAFFCFGFFTRRKSLQKKGELPEPLLKGFRLVKKAEPEEE